MLKLVTLSAAIMALPVVATMVEKDLSPLTTPAALHYKPALLSLHAGTKKPIGETDSAALAKSGWYNEAIKQIAQQEYEFKPATDAADYVTPNRHNNLRFTYTGKGFTVQPQTTSIPVEKTGPLTTPGKIKYATLPNWKVAFILDEQQIGKGAWQVNGNKAEYITDNITVQYINKEEGMRQNFIVKTAPVNNDDVSINFNIETALKTQLQHNRLLFSNKQGVVLNYDQLKVWDANGQPLEASFEKSNSDYCIHVQSQNAVYPITIDPISTTPATMMESNQAIANFGYSIASAGDVNGDGYSDVIVGAYSYDNGETDEGAAFIYHGSATGISATAATLLESNQAGAYFGAAVASAGDVNNDGYSDVIVGAYNYDNGEINEGAAYIYTGSAAGIVPTTAAIVESNQAAAQLGIAVACAGDVNGDGYSDVIVGANLYSNGQSNEGVAFVFHGSAAVINTTPAAILEANQASANFGYSVAGAGDVNGDGYSDIVVGANLYDNGQTDEGAAFIFHGSAAGINTTAAAMVESNQATSALGISVACAGDVNGDGFSDIIAGANLYDNGQTNEGAAFIYHGSATGISTTAASILEGNAANAWQGLSVACAGDVNGDGFSDVVVGATGLISQGAALVCTGSATGINITTATTITSGQTGANMGNAVASAGDVNGDGYSDIIVGANLYDNGQTDEGAAFIYHGSPNQLTTTYATFFDCNQANAMSGNGVSGIGDVNGDGYADVIIGAPYYNNGQTQEGVAFIYHGSAAGLSTTAAALLESNSTYSLFGVSVAGAGDVNGDGYSDVIVGASTYSNGQAYEGAAFIYHGSASGINTTAAARVESNQANADFGIGVACAGDVNNDGYSDVIVGADRYDNNGYTDEGAAFVYHGSASGINTTAAARVESNQASAYFGRMVASAGDVNGDGYSDVIVGAYSYDNGETDEGAAFVYHGSASGILPTAAFMAESNEAAATMGYGVAGADLNGDGYSDIMAGIPQYGHPNTIGGAVFIYYGSPSGITTTGMTQIIGAIVNEHMGYSVANAGDVNGDGYEDMIEGSPFYMNPTFNEGYFRIYLGSPAGITTTPAADAKSNSYYAQLGYCVAGAGDINGDGFDDWIAGANRYTNGEYWEGAGFVYYGNNLRNGIKLYNTDLTTSLSNVNIPLTNFGTGLYAKAFQGRVKGKMVWETRLTYNAYSGTPITNSVLYTANQSTYTDLGTAGIELKNLVNKVLVPQKYTRVRARIKYDPVTAITGQVYSPWRYAPEALYIPTALPVDLISFTAQWLQKGRTAQLKIVTDNEKEVCCYEIEKSPDGAQFTTIGKLTAQNTGTRTNYSFTDNNATAAKQYYRLKTINQNGNIEYSNLQLLQSNVAVEVMVFPNPATDAITLRLNNSYSTMTVQLINAAGQTVQTLNNLSTAGQQITIPINNIAAGTYFLYLQSGNEKQVLQFIKQ